MSTDQPRVLRLTLTDNTDVPVVISLNATTQLAVKNKDAEGSLVIGEIVKTDYTEKPAAEVVVGDVVVITRETGTYHGMVTELAEEPIDLEEEAVTEDELEARKDLVIKQLLQRVSDLEDAILKIADNPDIIRRIVTISASQLGQAFQSEQILNTLAHVTLNRAANALVEQAKRSNDRTPELMVIENYVPGSMRVIQAEDGSIELCQQRADTGTNASNGWEQQALTQEATDAMASLLAGYGVDAGRAYFIVDRHELADYQQKAGREAAVAAAASHQVGEAAVVSAAAEPA